MGNGMLQVVKASKGLGSPLKVFFVLLVLFEAVHWERNFAEFRNHEAVIAGESNEAFEPARSGCERVVLDRLVASSRYIEGTISPTKSNQDMFIVENFKLGRVQAEVEGLTVSDKCFKEWQYDVAWTGLMR